MPMTNYTPYRAGAYNKHVGRNLVDSGHTCDKHSAARNQTIILIHTDLIHHPVLHNCPVTFELFSFQQNLIHGATSTYKIIFDLDWGWISSGRNLPGRGAHP